jgi:Uncharacterised protein family (UPF0158)
MLPTTSVPEGAPMDQHTPGDVQAAFELVGALVLENHAAGRRSYGASLKPELKRRTDNAFDEHSYGFSTFTDFLRAAAGAGVIDIYKAQRGPDHEAVPPGRSPSALAPRADPIPSTVPRVRADIWQGFVDWRTGWTRVYQRSLDRSDWFPTEPLELERAELSAKRKDFQDKPEDYVEITPISFEEQVGWMREFATDVPDESARQVLEFALSRDRPAKEFAAALAGRPTLLRQWRAERIRRVLEVVRAWMAEHSLKFELAEPPRPVPSVSATSAESPSISRDTIRQLLREAIDRMPESELLRLAIPLEYLIGD